MTDVLEGVDLKAPHRGALAELKCHTSLILSDTPVPHRQSDGSAKMRWRAVIVCYEPDCIHQIGQVDWIDDPCVIGSIATAEGFEAKFAGFIGKAMRIVGTDELNANLDRDGWFSTGRDFQIEQRQQGNWVPLPGFIARATVILDAEQPTSLNVIMVDA